MENNHLAQSIVRGELFNLIATYFHHGRFGGKSNCYPLGKYNMLAARGLCSKQESTDSCQYTTCLGC